MQDNYSYQVFGVLQDDFAQKEAGTYAPGDQLHVASDVLEVTPSRSRTAEWSSCPETRNHSGESYRSSPESSSFRSL